jgi:hypothetical protein
VTGKSIAHFLAAALAEIGGAYLVWIGLKEGRGVLFVVLGVISLGSIASSPRFSRATNSAGSSPPTVVSPSSDRSPGRWPSTVSGLIVST